MLESLESGRSKPKGFMLLEVVLSVFIVSVGVVFVIGSFITSIKAFKASKSYLEVLNLIDEKMWQYLESGKIEEGSDSGEFEDYKGAEWNIEAKELEDDSPLEEVTLEVSLKEGEMERSVKIATYLFSEE